MSNPSPENAETPGQPSRWSQYKELARTAWTKRPSFSELHYYYIPLAIGVLGTGTVITDDLFDLHLAQTMAEVRVDANDNFLEEWLHQTIHSIGELAVELED